MSKHIVQKELGAQDVHSQPDRTGWGRGWSWSLVALLLASVGVSNGCYSAGDGSGATSFNNVECTADAGTLFRCKDGKIQKCDGSSWSTEKDCSKTGQSCTASGTNASCEGELSCSTGKVDGKCKIDSKCENDSNCNSGVCGVGGTCIGETCDNGKQDGDETGPDCGGSCPACVDEPCAEDSDCSTNFCKDQVCAAPSCTDGVQNGTETGVDCGGDCMPCEVGASCDSDKDCKSGRCESGQCESVPASCEDGEQNGSETDVDCGGPQCSGCPLDDECSENTDCLSSFCNFGKCDRATCSDMIKNQGESAEDCGGPNCMPCGNGKSCNQDSDCQSDRCTSGQCTSCSDGTQNGDETGVDCGGSCSACDDGASCQVDSDCSGGKCKNGECCTANQCGNCGPLPEETCNGKDDDCDGQTDERLTKSCGSETTGQCQLGTRECTNGVWGSCTGKVGPSTETCDGRDNDCDGDVDEATKGAGESCSGDCNCHSGRCESGTCTHRVFVTGDGYDGDLGGLSGADSTCANAASKQNLGGTWKAVLSSSTVDAKDRLQISGPVYNMNGEKVADGRYDFWDDNVDNPVPWTEKVLEVPTRWRGWVWTGTTTSGRGKSNTCSDWTTSSSTLDGAPGDCQDTNHEWIEEDDKYAPEACDSKLRLYCIDGQ